MHLIVYTSELAGQGDINSILKDIVSVSKQKNPEHDITGLLFYHNQRFLQIIEGEQGELENLMAVLEQDTRHKNIERIIDRDIRKRGFGQWNMDSINLSDTDTIDPEELKKIRDAYTRNLIVDSETVANFYRQMLESRFFRQDEMK